MNKKNINKRQTVTKEKQLEKIHYRILIALLIIGIVNYYFFRPTLVGYDIRYTIYVFLLPTAVGILALAFYRKNFLIRKYLLPYKFIYKFLLFSFYLIQGFLFSFLSFGLVSVMIFNFINKSLAKQNQSELITCEITKFWRGSKQSNIDFIFNKRSEKLDVNYEIIKEYQDKNADNYKLELTVRKGLWNYYLVEDWKVKIK